MTFEVKIFFCRFGFDIYRSLATPEVLFNEKKSEIELRVKTVALKLMALTALFTN